ILRAASDCTGRLISKWMKRITGIPLPLKKESAGTIFSAWKRPCGRRPLPISRISIIWHSPDYWVMGKLDGGLPLNGTGRIIRTDWVRSGIALKSCASGIILLIGSPGDPKLRVPMNNYIVDPTNRFYHPRTSEGNHLEKKYICSNYWL